MAPYIDLHRQILPYHKAVGFGRVWFGHLQRCLGDVGQCLGMLLPVAQFPGMQRNYLEQSNANST